MLTREGCLARRQRLWNQLPADISWVLICDPRHVLYLSGFLVNPISFSGGERAWLLLKRDGLATLLGDNFALRSRIAEPFVDDEIMVRWYDHQHSVINRDQILLDALTQALPRLAGQRGIAERQWLSAAGADVLAGAGHPPTATDPDLGTLIRGLRRQKEADEIALIRRSAAAGEAGHARAREIIRPGISELELYREVQSAAIAAAGTPAIVYGDFRACIASQPKVGGLPTDYRLAAGDLFVLDYSVVIGGYRADFTTALAAGEPSPQQLEQMTLCLAALAAGAKVLTPGVHCRDVYDAVERPFRDAGMADYFKHHAGHGIGLAHPEPPILVPRSDDVLQIGDVITLEPGLYVAGVGGIRIEHNYLITPSGAEQLTNHLIAL